MATDYPTFRRDLDAVLRLQDPSRLREFLIERDQWSADTQTDAESAMWLMIAASPNLSDLRPAARAWLEGHGRASEAAAIMDRPASGSQHPHKKRPPRKHTAPRQP